MDRRTFLGLGGAWSVGACVGRPVEVEESGERPWLRLSSNENPRGMSPHARAAIDGYAPTAHHLPWMPYGELVAALAAHHAVPPEAIVVGSGSTEVIRMAVEVVARDGGRIVVTDPTYEDAVTYAEGWRVPVVRVPLTAALATDLDPLREAAGEGPALVYLANPSNPVGTVSAKADLERFVDEAPDGVTVLVDEAYHEFGGDDPSYGSVVSRASAQPNLIVTRSFSKVHGLAGLRIGYGITHPDTASRLRVFALHHNANHLSVYAALAALEDTEHVRLSLEENRTTRKVVTDVLDELGLRWIPSPTNFVLHEIRSDVGTYVARMRERRIWVGRPFPRLEGYDRLSIGSRDDMATFLDTLRDFRQRGWV